LLRRPKHSKIEVVAPKEEEEGAFAELRKVTVSFNISVRPSFYQYGAPQLPLQEVS
jgi:hypothetical protein